MTTTVTAAVIDTAACTRIDGSGGKRVGMCTDRQDLGPLLAMIREPWFQGLSAFENKFAPDLGPDRGHGHSHSHEQWPHLTAIHLIFSDIRHKRPLFALLQKIGRS